MRRTERGQEKSYRTGQANPHCICVIPKNTHYFPDNDWGTDKDKLLSTQAWSLTRIILSWLLSIMHFLPPDLFIKAPWVIHSSEYIRALVVVEAIPCYQNGGFGQQTVSLGDSHFVSVVTVGGLQIVKQNENIGFVTYMQSGSNWVHFTQGSRKCASFLVVILATFTFKFPTRVSCRAIYVWLRIEISNLQHYNHLTGQCAR